MIEILESFPKIQTVCNEIHVDFADPEPASYGLSSTGDSLVSEDVLGNQIRQHGFLLYSTFSGINDFERQENSTALLELAVWLREQIGAEVQTTIGDKTYSGEIIRISAENGMLYAVPQENNIDGMQYQLQITARYTVEF
nr:MAG: Minor capsid protein from bacteriophage [Bacteriophage sp.]